MRCQVHSCVRSSKGKIRVGTHDDDDDDDDSKCSANSERVVTI